MIESTWNRLRGFEFISSIIDPLTEEELNQLKSDFMPNRKTEKSAGYDIKSMFDCTIPPGDSVIIKTGLKAYMQNNEFLALYIRSGLAIKQNLELVNQTGIIDADYYNNPDNEGHILVAIRNNNKYVPITICKGDRIAQGIFQKYYQVDNDESNGIRTGGIGSTGR